MISAFRTPYPKYFCMRFLCERSRILPINRTNRISISHVAFEKRAIQATGEVQQQLKCPVSFHPGRNAAAPSEIMRIYQEAGGDARKAILSHLDRTCNHMLLNDTRCSTIGRYVRPRWVESRRISDILNPDNEKSRTVLST